MKRRLLLRAVAIYLVLLVVSWWFDREHPSSLPTAEGWREIAVSFLADGEVRQAPLRYRKFSGTDKSLAPVLFIHGSPMVSSCFDPLLQKLSSDRTYLIPDLPGFGQSKYGFDDYSFDGHADALRQLLVTEGIGEVHVVAYSQGGGAMLKLLHSSPDRVKSVTFLSSIGVLEHELTGDYFLNQLLYGGQLFFLKLLDWGTPHFGLLNDFLLNPRYAENFYFSDMRPLRSILESAQKPALILHSESDRLVPKSAALEHFRILPQSYLFWGEGGHMMLMSQPEWTRSRLQNFFSSVESGKAPMRNQADEARLLEAAKDFQTIQYTRSTAILAITLFAIGLGTLVSEDLTCIAAGLLAARGLIPLSCAMSACFLGIWVGDMLLYFTGRYGGRRLLSCWPFKKMIASSTIDSTQDWLNRRGGMAVLVSRFMPGTRLPLYLTAGLVRMNMLKMMLWLAFSGLLWAFPVVALVVYLGKDFSELLTSNGKFLLPGILIFILSAFFFTKLIAILMTFEGRRKVHARIQRVKRWEFWPLAVFYTPVALALAAAFLRKGKPLAFTSCNPGMPFSGLVGEPKKEILDHLKPSGCVPRYLKISGASAEKLGIVRDWVNTEKLTFPMVIKPDRGERGKDVRILNDEAELEVELRKRKGDMLVQEYVGGLEFGVFYLRHPDDAIGSVISLTRKVMTSVKGDGRSTLKELILKDSRAVLSYKYFFRSFKDHLLEIPEAGQDFQLALIGSHCRGSLFLNGSDLITPELEAEIDRISKCFDGFYLGRFDIRCPSESDLQRGRNLSVIELNGITSEQTHIFHPHTPLRTGLKTVIRQWQKAHEIGLVNIDKGAHQPSFFELFESLRKA